MQSNIFLARLLPSHRRISYLGVLLAALLLLSACGGLAGEPAIVATIPSRPTEAQPVSQDVGFPQTPPDLSVGAQVFAARCVRCHGANGDGSNSELVLSGQLAAPPPNLSDPATVRGMIPADWFEIITNGRMDKLMPPWGSTLSESERWAVTLYAYTLSHPPEQIERGQTVWEANCAECHGESGKGDGPKAAESSQPVPDLTQPQSLLTASDQSLFDTVTNGKGEAMPAYGDTLDEGQRWDVAAYTRTLALANVDSLGQLVQQPAATVEVAGPASTEEATTIASVMGTVTGQVTNGTASGQVPSDMTITLHIVDSQFNEESQDVAASPDGSFVFNNVPIRDDRGYIVTAVYGDHIFASDLATGDPTAPAISLPITVYDVIGDPSIINISSILMQITSTGSGLQVVEVITFNNSSDRLFTSNQSFDGSHYASVKVPLPPGAQNVNFDNPSRYSLTADQTSVIDTRPVLPGDNHLVHLIYTMPYTGSASFAYKLDYPLDGPVQLSISPQTLVVSSNQLSNFGPQTSQGVVYQNYGATLSLSAGDTLGFQVNGDASTAATSSTPATIITSDNLLAIVLIVGGVIILAMALGLYLWRQRRLPAAVVVNDQEQLINGLIRQIAELDDSHQAGKVNDTTYKKRRKRLKARLAELLDQDE